MIGDGINDSPALSAADAGIAISEGAEIAREIADITISEDNLFQLVTLRAISRALMDRIDRNYRFVIGFNLGLILLGVGGVITPAASAGYQFKEHDQSSGLIFEGAYRKKIKSPFLYFTIILGMEESKWTYVYFLSFIVKKIVPYA